MSERAERVRRRLAGEHGVEALLVADPANVRYLTGFTGHAVGGLLLLPDRLLLGVDGRYRAEAEGHDAEVVGHDEVAGAVRGAVERVAVEADHLTLAEHARLADRLAGVELVPTEGVVLAERLVKDEGEIALVRAAAAISRRAFDDLEAAEPVGWTEREIATFLVRRMEEHGADGAAFDTIALVGERTAAPHAEPSQARLEDGACLLVDGGARLDGYRADMTRTLWWGTLRDDLAAVVEATRAAYDAALPLLVPGTPYADVDAAVREAYRERDLEQFVVHPCGHNIGLDVHEQPYFARRFDAELAAGHVVTLEPGAYAPGLGGARHENTIVVTADGPVELTGAAAAGVGA